MINNLGARDAPTTGRHDQEDRLAAGSCRRRIGRSQNTEDVLRANTGFTVVMKAQCSVGEAPACLSRLNPPGFGNEALSGADFHRLYVLSISYLAPLHDTTMIC